MFLSAKPYLCGSCHATKSAALSLQKSKKHSNLTCQQCHVEPGVAGFVSFYIKEISNLGRTLYFWRNESAKSNISDKACNRCHESISEITITKKEDNVEIKLSHQHFTDVGYRCVDCHNTIAHGKNVTQPNFVSIDKCVVCHNGKKAGKYPWLFDADKSALAKNDDNEELTPWAVTHGENRIKNHGFGNLESCKGCHSQKFCNKCHNIELPHSSEFTFEHGKLSMEKDATCFTCHNKKLCVDCHKIRIPHPYNWLANHSKVAAKTDEKTCTNCHSKYDCENCHDRHVHPGQGKDGVKFFTK